MQARLLTSPQAGPRIIAGLKRDYLLVDEESAAVSEVFKVGASQEPTITRLPENEFLLGKDELSIFVGLDSKPTRKYGIKWAVEPLAVQYNAPYVVAITAREIEVRTVETAALVQQIDHPKARFVCQGEALYVASPSNCWRLEPVPLGMQIKVRGPRAPPPPPRRHATHARTGPAARGQL